MKPSTNFMRGKTSRSLKAAYVTAKMELTAGVGHLEGGLVAWYACINYISARVHRSHSVFLLHLPPAL
jgi:hypothetical protein